MMTACVLCICMAAAPVFPGTFEQWGQQRVGPVVFPEGSSRSWEEVTGFAQEVGAKAVKTWVGGTKPGEGLARVKSEPYRKLIRTFPVVHFNLSLSYIVDGYESGRIKPESLDALEKEWRDITLFLCRERAFPDQIFLLSVGGEINVYLGTAGTYPEFPVAEYVNACHAAKEAALAEVPEADRARIYSVAELQGDKEFDRFAAQWVPAFETDLVSLSYYVFYRAPAECLGVLRRLMKPCGPFGDQRLMLGEYGPSIEACNWNQAAHARWHDEILRTAYAEHVQFAFFYEIADHEFVIKTGSHDGLVKGDKGAERRLAWTYYASLYSGRAPVLPEGDVYESHEQEPPETSERAPNLVVKNFAPVSPEIHAGDTVSFSVTVSNEGTEASSATTVNFFVDDKLISWVWIPSIAQGLSLTLRCDQGDARFTWRAQAGTHRATAVADGPGNNAETNEQDNVAHLSLMVPAANK